jgi:SNF5 / SMARCB1 / INI1
VKGGHADACSLYSCATQIDVPVGSKRFRDEALWDANDPLNTPETYASSVSSALGLNWDAALSIRRAVKEQLSTAQQVRQAHI